MRKFLWCFFRTSRNYQENDSLTALVYKCIWLIENCPNVTVDITQYDINIKTETTKIQLWNENKWYAWLSRGDVNGRKFTDISPSKSAMYDFKQCLEKRGYNLHPKKLEPPIVIEIADVKC